MPAQLTGRVKVTLLEATDRVLGAFDTRMSSYAHKALLDRGANVRCGTAVIRVHNKYAEIRVKNDASEREKNPTKEWSCILEHVSYGLLVWAGGIAVRPLVKDLAAQVCACGVVWCGVVWCGVV